MMNPTSSATVTTQRLFHNAVRDTSNTLINIYKAQKPATNQLKRVFSAIPGNIIDLSGAQIALLPKKRRLPLSRLGADAEHYFPNNVFEVLRTIVPDYHMVAGPDYSPPRVSTPPPSVSQFQPLTTSSAAYQTAPQSTPAGVRAATQAMRSKGIVTLKSRTRHISGTPLRSITPTKPRTLFSSTSFPKRHRRILKTNNLSTGTVKRLARRGGCKRIASDVKHDVNSCLRSFLYNIISSAVVYTDYAKRRTVTLQDVNMALKMHGKTLYGF